MSLFFMYKLDKYKLNSFVLQFRVTETQRDQMYIVKIRLFLSGSQKISSKRLIES